MPVEDYRAGYPQFSALIGSHSSFYVFRRFLRTRARILLMKQDEISLLESQLDRVDRDETRELFLGNARRDTNADRKILLTKLEAALYRYDAWIERSRAMAAHNNPRTIAVTNLRNWIDSTSSLAEEETAYLSQEMDLLTLHSPKDDSLARLTPLVEKVLRFIYRLFRKPQSKVSTDPNISILPLWLLARFTRLLVAWIVIVLLLTPIIVINALSSTTLRLVVIIIATTVLVTVIMSVTNAKVFEVLVSGAT